MKKLLLLLALVLSTACLMAQGNHFTFRDIPIDGTVAEISKKLQNIGFTATDYPNMLKGKFLGEDCQLVIQASDYNKTVYSIAVFMPEKSRWSTLKSSYLSVKEMYSKKYGEPKKFLETFDSPYYDGDGYELSAVKLDKCTYISYWEMANGGISLSITDGCELLIIYRDKRNEELHEQAKNNSFESEI